MLSGTIDFIFIKLIYPSLGLNYVSCSPFRVPVARLSAAQCAIEDDRKRAAEGAKDSIIVDEKGAKAAEAKARDNASDKKIPKLPPKPARFELEKDEDDRKDVIVNELYSPRRAV